MWLPALIALTLTLPAASDDDAKGFRAAASSGQGPKRVALVIGNARYTHRPLRNPTRDAKAMAASLDALGFEVDARFDLNREGMLRALRDFGARLDRDTVALFYYSGHGISHDGRSYMLPTDFKIATDTDIDLEAVDLRRITARLEEAGSRLNLIVLDACRDDPLDISGLKSSAGGLAFVSAPSGTLIAYATAPGRTASDGRGRLSPYTRALVEEMKVPDRTVEATFKAVRRRVRVATDGAQVPWESSSLEGRFVFATTGAPTGEGAPSSSSTAAAPAPDVDERPASADASGARHPEADSGNSDNEDAIELLRRRRRQRADASSSPPAKPSAPRSVEERYAVTGRQLNNYLVALGCFSAVTAVCLGASGLSIALLVASSAVPGIATFALPLLTVAVFGASTGSTMGLLTGCCGLATGELFWRRLKLGSQLEEQGPGEEGAEQGGMSMAY